jgi:putative membrane protein
MNNLIRRGGVLAGLGALSVASVGVCASAAFADNTAGGNVKVSNTETVQVAMDASGKIDAQRIYEQLVLTGNGKVDIANPVSTKGLRNLDGFGGFDVRDGKAQVKTDVDGTKKYRSVSDFTKKLPLDIAITYKLDGHRIDPQDVVGKSGNLEVRYVVKNVTGQVEDVKYENGAGAEKTSSENVVIPMVGKLETTLPSNFTKVVPDGANPAGDGRGGTLLSYTMTLIPPIGKATAEFGYTAKVKDATIPKADVSALPVNPLENVSFKGGAESYKGGAETGQDLTAGATEIDANVVKLRDGAQDLVAGLLKLQDGAGQLSDGTGDLSTGAAQLRAEGTSELAAGASRLQKEGTGEVAAGASKLDAGAGKVRAGAGQLDSGAGQLDQGASDLSDGLKKAGANAPALLVGLKTVADGLAQVDAGLSQLNGQVVPGANQISGGASALISAIDGQLAPGLDQVSGALDQALAVAAGVTDATQKGQLTALLTGAKSGVATVKGGLTGSVKSGLTGIKGGGDAISDGVTGATGSSGSLKNGVAALQAGVKQLQDGGVVLAGGLGALSAGADKLKAGTSDLKSGTGALKSGASDLKSGTSDLKSGAKTLDGKASELGAGAKTVDGKMGELLAGSLRLNAGSLQLKAGLDQAAESAPALPEGADRLSKEGTSQIVEAGDKTASDFGMRYSLLEAGATRAASAQPYGSPEGATALTAYKFEIAGEDGAGSANLERGLAALLLLAGAGAVTSARRRGLI